MILIGTHDSGTWYWSGMRPIENPKWYYTISRWPLFSYIANFSAKCQTDSLKRQLERGVNFFDFRLAIGEDKELYLGHTFLCRKLVDEMSDIKDFIKSNPTKVPTIFLRLDHFHKSAFTAEYIAKIYEVFKDSGCIFYTSEPLLINYNSMFQNGTSYTFVPLLPGSDLNSIIKNFFTFGSLLKDGLKAQEGLDNYLLSIKDNTDIKAVTFDAITDETIIKMIEFNKNRL